MAVALTMNVWRSLLFPLMESFYFGLRLSFTDFRQGFSGRSSRYHDGFDFLLSSTYGSFE